MNMNDDAIPLTPEITGSTVGAIPKTCLRILQLEDSAIDADLIQRELKRHGLVFETLRVETKETLRMALAKFEPHIVLSDLSMPTFSGEEGLKVTRELCAELPFIYVSGTIGEEHAIELLKKGATDYVLKQNLARLTPAVERALREAEGIREQRRTDERLRKLSGAVEHGPSAIFITDTEGRIEYVNPKFTEITGYTADEVIGQTPCILKSGETSDAVYANLWKTIRAGHDWHGEFHNRRKDGKMVWESTSISPILDAAGAITHFVGVAEDITDRKSLEAQLRRAQRLEAIGTLATGLAHDLNNVLAPILMATPLLAEALAGTKYEDIVSTIGQCAERGAGIVKQVITFAHGSEGQRVLVQVSHLMRDICKVATETFPRSIAIKNLAKSDLWPIMADATQVHQILLNLCINARDAMPDGGKLTMSAENLQIDENYASMIPEATLGSYLVLTVSDTGHGIPEGIREKIFDPFFTTKLMGRGTGLGLATVNGIVKNHQGFIRLDSESGRGTTFQVFLPAEEHGEAVAIMVPPTAAARGNGELILIVDDEVSILAATKMVLETAGYRVLLANDGVEALGIFAHEANEIALVLTDVAMPFMDGPALTRTLRHMDPYVRVIISTGHKTRSDVEALAVNAFLAKPYDASTLLRAIHTVLSEPVPATGHLKEQRVNLV